MFLELLLCLGVLVLVDYIIRSRLTRKLANIPIVSRIPLIGSLLVLATITPDNLHLKFHEFVNRYGKSFYAKVFGRLVFVTVDKRYVDALLSSQQHIDKHVIYELLRGWLGNGLLLNRGKPWQTMRKIITPTFHFTILEQFVEVFDRQTNVMMEHLKTLANDQQAIDIYPYIGLLTLDIITETAMGVGVNAQRNSKSDIVQAINDVTDIIATRFVRPLIAFPSIFRLLVPHMARKQEKSISILHEFTRDIIREKRQTLLKAAEQSIDPGNDVGLKRRLAFLDVLLQATIDGKPLTDQQIVDEVNTFIFEGHDTTTSAISFCLYLLSRHPESQQKLFEEIRCHFRDDLNRSITFADLQQMTFLNCVIKESLRLFPPVPAIGRWIKNDFQLEDITLPSGSNVIVLLWELLRSPDIFQEPNSFLPERHLTDNTYAQPFSNIPFSAGPRNCVGQRFALMEIRTVVIKVVRHFELLPLGPEVQPSIKIVLRSKTGINLGLKKR